MINLRVSGCDSCGCDTRFYSEACADTHTHTHTHTPLKAQLTLKSQFPQFTFE